MTALDCSALATATAQHLGEGWTCSSTSRWRDEWWQKLSHTDGRALTLTTTHDVERVTVHGIYPTPNDLAGSSFPRITVRASRGPAVIAAEITRRFLPTYDLLHAEAKIQAAPHWKREEVVREQADEIASLLPAGRRDPDSGTVHFTLPERAGSGVITVYLGEIASVAIHIIPLNIAHATAEAIRRTAATSI
jgi:hypothetical protein